MPVEPHLAAAMLFILRAVAEPFKRFIWPNPLRARGYVPRHTLAPGRTRVSERILRNAMENSHSARFRLA